MTSRIVDALLAAAATIAAILGLTTLTENSTWLGRAIWACLVVAVVGVLLRQLTSFRLLVLFGEMTYFAHPTRFGSGRQGHAGARLRRLSVGKPRGKYQNSD